MDRLELRAFSGVDGKPIKRISYLDCSWSDSLNETGTISISVPNSVDVTSFCAPYKVILAVMTKERILHAGYVTHLRFNRSSGNWTIDGGGGLSILKKRLVVNHMLATSWNDGSVVVDEDNPSGNWLFSLNGSYSDIIRGLLLETLKFGSLPILVKPYTGGGHERNYNSFDLATTYDRIHDITQLEDGIEVRLDPKLDERGYLVFEQRSEEEIVDHHWKWNTTLPGSLVIEQDVDIDSDSLCSESYGTGGKEDDSLLVARASSVSLLEAGYPVLQVANTEHSSVSELPTLQSYVRSDVNWGSVEPKTQGFIADISLDVKCGDWADIRTSKGMRYMKITDVSGSVSQGYLTLQATERY